MPGSSPAKGTDESTSPNMIGLRLLSITFGGSSFRLSVLYKRAPRGRGITKMLTAPLREAWYLFCILWNLLLYRKVKATRSFPCYLELYLNVVEQSLSSYPPGAYYPRIPCGDFGSAISREPMVLSCGNGSHTNDVGPMVRHQLKI